MPANDLIKIDNSNVVTAPYANDILNLVSQAQGLAQRLQGITGRFAHLNDGTAFGPLETKYGIPTGSGSLVNAVLVTLLSTLNSDANFQALINRIG